VALLVLYYVKLNHDPSLAVANIKPIDAAMSHNQLVGDPHTGIAYNFQDTNTTFDDQKDCLHNDGSNAGNNYYQGVKEATGYRAAAYLDSLVHGDSKGATWKNDAAKIENAIVQEYSHNGFIPVAANNNAFNNCNGRTLALGDGLFYLQLSGLANTMNQALLQDLGGQYRNDLSADTLSTPSMVVLESIRATGSQCQNGSCPRYEWFSKVMLSSIIADIVYYHHGCSACRRIDVTQQVYNYNNDFSQNFGDGFRDDGSTWGGHFYPRGVISWAFLSASY
jgi:hypothetical protein